MQDLPTAPLPTEERGEVLNDLTITKIILLANLLRRSASIRHGSRFGMSRVEWRVIGLIGPGEPINLNTLARRAGLDVAQMSRGVSSLVKRGLVHRETNKADTREILISLTDDGLNLYKVMYDMAVARTNELLSFMTPKEKSVFVDQINRIVDTAQRAFDEDQQLYGANRTAKRG